jgi:hypothetical protein
LLIFAVENVIFLKEMDLLKRQSERSAAPLLCEAAEFYALVEALRAVAALRDEVQAHATYVLGRVEVVWRGNHLQQ